MESLQQQTLKVNSHIQFFTRHQEHVRETTGVHIRIIILSADQEKSTKKTSNKKWNLSKVEESNADDERLKNEV